MHLSIVYFLYIKTRGGDLIKLKKKYKYDRGGDAYIYNLGYDFYRNQLIL